MPSPSSMVDCKKLAGLSVGLATSTSVAPLPGTQDPVRSVGHYRTANYGKLKINTTTFSYFDASLSVYGPSDNHAV